MRKNDVKKYSFYITLIIFITGAFISFELSSKQLKTRTQAKASVSLNSENLTLASSYSENQDASFFTLSGSDTSSQLYSVTQNSSDKIIDFIAQQPQFSPRTIKTYQGESGQGQDTQKNLIPDDVKNFTLKSFKDDVEKGEASHYYFQQTRCDGVPVFGSYLNIHVGSQSNNIYNVSGAVMKDKDTPCQGSVSNETAETTATNALKTYLDTQDEMRIVASNQYIYDPSLVDVEGANTSYFTQNVLVCSKENYCRIYFVDLNSGNIVYGYQFSADGMNRYINAGNSVRKEGDAPVGNSEVNTAYDDIGKTYDYFKTTHNRDSYDNNGGIIQVKIEECLKLNAYWDGNGINVCSGLVQSDILAHELHHGVTQYAVGGRDGLQYVSESGALNESLSDVIGYALDSDDWTIAEGSDLGVIRDMSNPPAKNDPDRLFASQYYCGSEDNGGVHINSGVFNKAFYLMVTGGTFGNSKGTCTISAIGKEKAITTVYKALTTYLKGKSTANYKDMYNAMNSACSDLYGATSTDCVQVKAAMESTEMNRQTEGCNRGPKCPKSGSQCGGKSEEAPTCAGGGGVPLPTTAGTTATPQPTSLTPEPSEAPTEEPTEAPTPTPEPQLKKTSKLKSTVSAPNFSNGEVTIEYIGGLYKLKADLNPQTLASLKGLNAQLGPNEPIGAKGYLIGKDRIDTGSFDFQADGSIINSFSSAKDLSSYHTYQVVVFDEKKEELPILIADVAFDKPQSDPDKPDNSTIDLVLSLRLQGISKKPTSTEGILVKVGIGGKDLEATVYRDIPFFPAEDGSWEGKATLDVPEGDSYKLLIKPARHIQKKFCENTPIEDAPGLYKCKAEKISLKKGKNILNLRNVIQLAGDLPAPKQDGVVNSFDVLRIRKNLNSTKYNDLISADVNSDGIVNAADDALVTFTLGNRSEQN